MAGGASGDSPSYSPFTGLVYIFNLIVGTGALTLPAAFRDAGYGLSSGVIVMLAFMSYLTATFMIEAMAAANAMRHWRRVQQLKRHSGRVSDEFLRRSLRRHRPSASEQDEDEGGGEGDANYHQVAVQSSSGSDDEDELAVDVGAGDFESEPLIAAQQQIDGTAGRESNAAGDAGLAGDEGIVAVSIRSASSSSSTRGSSSRNMSAYYEITEVIEMGKMAGMFFNRTGRTLFYLCIAIYLYGDLAIYAAAVAKSLRDVACTYEPPNATRHFNISEHEKCWKESDEITRIDVYRFTLSTYLFIRTLANGIRSLTG